MKEEENKKIEIQKQKNDIEKEIRIIVRKLIHPQAKDHYDEETEAKIIAKCKTINIIDFYSY